MRTPPHHPHCPLSFFPFPSVLIFSIRPVCLFQALVEAVLQIQVTLPQDEPRGSVTSSERCSSSPPRSELLSLLALCLQPFP
ncbi:hypothetical protein NQZ68_039161 [Dissostichus eleginoides]|nr:hypothetical protein NQZ68_039161 [Dissostichus eleginoides]